MEGLLLPVMAGLFGALAMTLGLWAWRRLSRTASPETGAGAATVALRTPGPHLASGDDDADRSSLRSGASARSTRASRGGAATVVPAERAPSGPQAANRPSHALAEKEVLEEEEMPEKESQPCAAGIALPPPSPPTAGATGPAVSVPGNGGAGSAGAGLSQADGGESLPETAGHDAAAPVPAPFDTADAPGNAIAAAANGAGDPPDEGLTDDLSGAGQLVAVSRAESGAGNCGTVSFPSSERENHAQEEAALAEPVSRSDPALEPAPEPPAGPAVRSRQPAVHRDRRGKRRTLATSGARAGIAHALVCRSGDAEAVRLAVAATGSPELQTHEHWQGIPDGWLVLSGYTPVHAAAPPLPTGFRTMDPGEGLEISFDGGLAVRGRVYAAGHPPRIIITPAPGAASVTIGGMPAELSSDGAWTAPGWDRPGQHMVDIVPGPSVSYEIAADPWLCGGWDFWDAHSQRFGNGAGEPWARARICGALIRGPVDETVFAAETRPTLVALGARAGATPLRRRADATVSVGLMAEPPAFLLSATGSRRTQGRVVWLGLTPAKNPSRRHDAAWVAIVRSAAARRLPLVQADAPGEDAWRKAKERARRLRNTRPRP